MTRKAATDGGKYENIINAAFECFFEKGFDGTSVRSIMKRAGGEIGLFYYYFDSKDHVFDKVLDRFFAHYEADFTEIVAHGRRNPCRVMQDFFEYMERETIRFREQYACKLHRTIRWAIREHTLTIIEPYLRQAVEIQSAYYGVTPALAPNIAALYLTYGVGSSILHEDSDAYGNDRAEVKKGVSLLMGMPIGGQKLRIPYLAVAEDVPGCMELVRTVKNNFPGLDEAEYEAQLARRIEQNETWVFRDQNKITAMQLFSRERRELDFLAVSPEYRRKGLAEKLVETAAAQFPVGTELSVITYREGDSMGKAARSFYAALGFVPGDEVTVFDTRCQRFARTVPDGPVKKNT